jgi:hypothetical protein
VATKKFKSAARRHAGIANPRRDINLVMAGSGAGGELFNSNNVEAEALAQFAWIGFGFQLGNGAWVIYWFPIFDVQGGADGADDAPQDG